MRTRLKTGAAAAAVVTMTALGLAACGGDDDKGDNGSGSTDTVGQTADTELTADNFFTEVLAAQQKAGSSHVTMTMEVMGQKITGEGDIAVGDTPADTAMQMTMAMGGLGEFDMRMVGTTMYMNLGPASENKFVEIDLTDENSPLGSQYGDLVENIDPASQLQQFEEAVIELEKTGESVEVDGVTAEGWALTLDPSKLESIADLGEAAGQLPQRLEYIMYVGPDNLPRRFIMDMAGAEMSMDYSKWGEKVTIEKPSADQITDKDPFAGLAPAA